MTLGYSADDKGANHLFFPLAQEVGISPKTALRCGMGPIMVQAMLPCLSPTIKFCAGMPARAAIAMACSTFFAVSNSVIAMFTAVLSCAIQRYASNWPCSFSPITGPQMVSESVMLMASWPFTAIICLRSLKLLYPSGVKYWLLSALVSSTITSLQSP